MQYRSHQNHARRALASLVTAGLIAVIPFLLPHYGLATAFYSEWVAFALGALACFPLLRKTFWLHLEIPPAAIWLFAVAVLITVQTLFVDQTYVTQALLPGIYVVWATILVVLGFWIRNQLGMERAVIVLAWMFLAGGALHAIVGFVQFLNVPGELGSMIDRRSESVYGNIGQRNHFATHITLASFALIYLYAMGRVYRTFAVALLALFALVLTASSSRAAVVYIIAGVSLSLIGYRVTKNLIHRRLLQGTGLLLALFFLFQYLLSPLNDWLKLLLGTMGFEINALDALVMLQRGAAEGIDVRVSELHKAWLMFMGSPVWGVGIGNYGWHSFIYQALPEFSAVPQGALFHHSHNLIMQVLAELGIAGFILLLSLGFIWLRQVLPHWKAPSYWLILALTMVLLLHSTVEYPLWYSYFLGMAAILLGLGSAEGVKIKFTPSLGQFTAGSILIFSGAMLAITLLGLQDLVHIHRLAIVAPQQAFATLRAVAKNPLLTPWAEVAMAQQWAPDEDRIEEQLLLATRVMQYRSNPHNVNRKIVYLALTKRPAEAIDLMQKTLVIYRSEFPKYACNWKFAPTKEVQYLWKEADKLTEGTIECQQKPKHRASPS